MVRQFLVTKVEAGFQIGLFEPEDGNPAVAGVPIGPVAEVGARLALHVEDRDVVALDVHQRGSVQMGKELR
jgi:hypothetical protein